MVVCSNAVIGSADGCISAAIAVMCSLHNGRDGVKATTGIVMSGIPSGLQVAKPHTKGASAPLGATVRITRQEGTTP